MAENLHPVITSSDDTPITTATSTDIAAAPGAGLSLRVSYLLVTNSHATQAVDVCFRVGASGQRYFRMNLPPLYGIYAHAFKRSWKLPTNTKLVLVTAQAGSVHWSMEGEFGPG